MEFMERDLTKRELEFICTGLHLLLNRLYRDYHNYAEKLNRHELREDPVLPFLNDDIAVTQKLIRMFEAKIEENAEGDAR